MPLISTGEPPHTLRRTLTACAAASVFFFSLGRNTAQNAARSSSAEADPVCGFTAGPHFYYEANQVRQGLGVDLIVGEAQINRPVTLRFFVHQKPRNFPVDRLQIEHGRFIHVIGIREDLEEFFHVHPERSSPGMWEVTRTFTNAGRYKIWADLKYRGIAYSFSHPLLAVAGDPAPTRETVKLEDSQTVSGFEINFQHPQTLVVGGTNRFQFVIRDGSGNPIETENFLGSPMHLVIVKEDLSVYLHAHPENKVGGTAPIVFSQSFAKPGAYRLFAQFRPRNTNLPEDEAILVKFQVRVEVGGRSPAAVRPTL
jgi:hypothetical protein